MQCGEATVLFVHGGSPKGNAFRGYDGSSSHPPNVKEHFIAKIYL